MTSTGLESFDRTLQKTNEWIKEVMAELGWEDRRRALRALRTVLHALRDHLTPQEAAELGAQLPMLVRGFYYEGWKPLGKPLPAPSRELFLARVHAELHTDFSAEPERVARAVLRVLGHHVTAGELADVRRLLPHAICDLLPGNGAPGEEPAAEPGGHEMKVRDIMQGEVRLCSPDNDLSAAGRMMAEVGCGVLPVVGEGDRVLGMLTDRDICLAVAKDNRRPSEIPVREAMTRGVFSCHPDDSLRRALKTMRERRVRRLPVVDDHGELRGLLSLDDVVLEARAVATEGFDGPFYSDVATTLRAINQRPVPVMA